MKVRRPFIWQMRILHRGWGWDVSAREHPDNKIPAGVRVTDWMERAWESNHRWLAVAVAKVVWRYYTQPPLEVYKKPAKSALGKAR